MTKTLHKGQNPTFPIMQLNDIFHLMLVKYHILSPLCPQSICFLSMKSEVTFLSYRWHELWSRTIQQMFLKHQNIKTSACNEALWKSDLCRDQSWGQLHKCSLPFMLRSYEDDWPQLCLIPDDVMFQIKLLVSPNPILNRFWMPSNPDDIIRIIFSNCIEISSTATGTHF